MATETLEPEVEDDVQDEVLDQEDEISSDAADDTEVEVTDDPSADVRDEEPEPESWIDDDIKGLASSYGLSESDVESFSGKDEFLRAARFFASRDKQEEAKTAKEPESEEQEEPKESPGFESIQKALEEAGYDESTVAVFKQMFDKNTDLESQLAELKSQAESQSQRQQEQERQRFSDDFHSIADKMGDRYGEGEFSEAEDRNRERLYMACLDVAHRMERLGESPLPLDQLMRRAEMVEFADEIVKEKAEAEKTELARKVKDQSRKRRSVGRSNKTSKPVDPDNPVQAILASPDIQDFLKENRM